MCYLPGGEFMNSELMAGEIPAFFPSFALVGKNSKLEIYQRKTLDTKTCLELLLIDKVVCVKRESRLMDIREAQKAFRYLEFSGGEMRESACTWCYAQEACKTGNGMKVVRKALSEVFP